MCYYHIKIPRFFKLIDINKSFKDDTKALFSRLFKHKKKCFFITSTFIAYYKREELLKKLNVIKDKTVSKLDSILQENNPVDRKFKNFLKQALGGTFKDDQIKREGVLYLEKILKDKVLIDRIIDILLKAIKEKTFTEEAKVLGKNLVVSASKDEKVEKGLLEMFIRIIKDPEVKFEATELVKFVLLQPDTKEEMINLFIKIFGDDKIVLGFKNLLAGAFFDVLSEKETAERLKIFVFNFLKNQEGHEKNSILDLLMDKVLKKEDNKNNEKDLDDFFKEIQSKKGIYFDKDLEKIWDEKNKDYSE